MTSEQVRELAIASREQAINLVVTHMVARLRFMSLFVFALLTRKSLLTMATTTSGGQTAYCAGMMRVGCVIAPTQSRASFGCDPRLVFPYSCDTMSN